MTFLRAVIALQLIACLIGWSYKDHQTWICEDGVRYVCVDFWFPTEFWIQHSHRLAVGYERHDGSWHAITLSENWQ